MAPDADACEEVALGVTGKFGMLDKLDVPLIHISTDYATDPMTFGSSYAYVACGHIHVPQPIGGGRGHYVGSLLEVDFGEEGETKQVLVVDTDTDTGGGASDVFEETP